MSRDVQQEVADKKLLEACPDCMRLRQQHAALERKVRAITAWLDLNQPDVWQRGIWDAIREAGK